MGRVPNVWEVYPSVEPQPFKDGIYTCNIPHTEYIQSCYQCINSTGRKKCLICQGVGSRSCSFCNMGTRNGASCSMCNGSGRKR